MLPTEPDYLSVIRQALSRRALIQQAVQATPYAQTQRIVRRRPRYGDFAWQQQVPPSWPQASGPRFLGGPWPSVLPQPRIPRVQLRPGLGPAPNPRRFV